jgi:hypothetical protein
MSTESEGFDPYAVVLADLKAKRDQIDQAIQAIESVRSGIPLTRTNPMAPESAPNDAGAYLGMSISDATKKLLSIRKQAMSNADIATALKQGGLVMSVNTDPQNTIGSVITRRFQQVGDIVKVGRGVWGLKEWYPNRTFDRTVKTRVPKTGISDPEQRIRQYLDSERVSSEPQSSEE